MVCNIAFLRSGTLIVRKFTRCAIACNDSKKVCAWTLNRTHSALYADVPRTPQVLGYHILHYVPIPHAYSRFLTMDALVPVNMVHEHGGSDNGNAKRALPLLPPHPTGVRGTANPLTLTRGVPCRPGDPLTHGCAGPNILRLKEATAIDIVAGTAPINAVTFHLLSHFPSIFEVYVSVSVLCVVHWRSLPPARPPSQHFRSVCASVYERPFWCVLFASDWLPQFMLASIGAKGFYHMACVNHRP